MPRKVTGVVLGVYAPEDGRRQVRIETKTGRVLFFDTTSARYVRGQTVELTATTVRRTGELVGVRFRRQVPVESDPALPSRRRFEVLQQKLSEFRKGLNGRRGTLVVEGTRVVSERGGERFTVPTTDGRKTRHAWARGAARAVLENLGVRPGWTVRRSGRKQTAEVRRETW